MSDLYHSKSHTVKAKILIVEDQFIEAKSLNVILTNAGYSTCSIARSVASALSVIEKEKPDVLIVGELSEWETAEYVRDARTFGSKTALIILGHSVSEEPGMEWLVEYFQPKIPAIKMTHIASGNPLRFV